MKKWISLALGILISVVIFIVLVGSDLTAVKDELANARYAYLIPGGLLFIAGIWTRAIRWRILLNHQIAVKHSFHIINVGYFASSILPMRLGDVARAWLATRLDEPIDGFSTLSTIVVERLMDLLSVLAMLGFTLVLIDVPREVSSAGALLGVMAIGGGLILTAFASRPQWAHQLLAFVEKLVHPLKRFNLHPLLDRFLNGIQPISNPRIALNALVWSGISWFLSVCAGYTFLYTVFDHPTLAAALAFIVLGSFSVALPAVPGNLGPFEGSVVGGLWIGGLIASAGAPANAPAVAFATILHATMMAIYISLGLVGLAVERASLGQLRRESREVMEPKKPMPNNKLDGPPSKPLVEIAHERAS